MSHNANSLFSALSTSQTGAWKPVTAAAGKSKSLVATAFSPPSAEAGDNVDVSPLAKALTGTAAKVFEKLDGKARGMLEDSVKAGVLTADDVVKGLRGIAKEAVQNRYLSEAPLTQEEMEYGNKRRAINETSEKFRNEKDNIINSYMKKIDDSPGDEKLVLTKEMGSVLAEHKDNFIKQYGDFEAEEEEYSEDFRARRLSNNLRHSNMFADEEDSAVFSVADTKAVEKLFNAGFRPADYRNAAKSFADDMDLSEIPDLARPEAKSQPAQAPAETLPPGYAESKAQMDASWQAATSRMMEAKKRVEEDPTVALLKANANASYSRQGYPALQQTPATTGTAAAQAGDNQAVLGGLSQMLKTGAASSDTGSEGTRTDTVV